MKRQAWTLEAVRRLREELGDVHAVFVGKGPELEAFQRARPGDGRGDWAHVLGVRDDVPAVLSLADLAVSVDDRGAPDDDDRDDGRRDPAGDDRGRRARPDAARGRRGLTVPVEDLDAFHVACRAVLSDPDLHTRLRAGALAAVDEFDARAWSAATTRCSRRRSGRPREQARAAVGAVEAS